MDCGSDYRVGIGVFTTRFFGAGVSEGLKHWHVGSSSHCFSFDNKYGAKYNSPVPGPVLWKIKKKTVGNRQFSGAFLISVLDYYLGVIFPFF
jgi:hypothetical protein